MTDPMEAPVDIAQPTGRERAGERFQRGLDSALNLLASRLSVLQQIDDRGRPTRPGVEIIGMGLAAIRRELIRQAWRYDDHRSTHPMLSMTDGSAWCDRQFVLRGGTMRSLYNIDSTRPGDTSTRAVNYFADEVLAGTVYAAPSPVQMIIHKHSIVLEGPKIDGERTAMAVSQPKVVHAALRYWQSQIALATPVQQIVSDDPLTRFTPRQREVAAMLADDLTDNAIAAKLGISRRTVQSEVAVIMRLLEARSRFGAGMKLGRLGFETYGHPVTERPQATYGTTSDTA